MLANRRALLAAAAALPLMAALSACNNAGGGAAATATADDIVLGAADAKLTVFEYASATCHACSAWHEAVYPEFNEKYVKTGKVRYVFVGYPNVFPDVDVMVFLFARCGGADNETAFNRIGAVFKNQGAINQAAQMGTAREELWKLASQSNLSREQFDACISDDAGIQRIATSAAAAKRQYGITATPTMVIDNQRYDAMSKDDFFALLDKKLGAG
jgi:protein-disulfide isomerase